MFTFLFCANIRHVPVRKLLQSAADVTGQVMPALGLELKRSFAEFPELRGGWFWLAPEGEEPPSLIDGVADTDTAVLLFGELLMSRQRSSAQAVRSAYLSGGPEKVRQLEGCFSAVVVDRRAHKVLLLSDMMGRRSLRYVTSQQMLLVSPHDLPLAATDLVPLEFDLLSAASTAAVDHSLLGRPMLRDVRVFSPMEYVRWRQGRAATLYSPLLPLKGRISSADRAGLFRHRRHMVETIRANAEAALSGAEDVMADLTAGLDSRAVLAALLSVANGTKIRVFSGGGMHSLDVRVARTLARVHGLEISFSQPSSPSHEHFLEYCDLLAFNMNGDTNAKRALDPLPVYSPCPTLRPWGGGGEIFRGYLYPDGRPGRRPDLSLEQALDRLKRRELSRDLPLQEPSLAQGVEERLETAVGELRRLSTNGYDVLDMFYLFERFRVWGAIKARLPWDRGYWSPFISPRLAQQAFRLPPPIGDHCRLHEELVRRYMPRGYWAPINWGAPLPLRPLEGRFPAVARYARRVLRRFCRNVREDGQGVEQLGAEGIIPLLADGLRDELLSEGSFAVRLFGRGSADLLLGQHISGEQNHLQVIGFLITMERWRKQVEKARELSRSAGGRSGG